MNKSCVLILVISLQTILVGQITFDDRSVFFRVNDDGNASGVAFVDYDNDDRPDIFVANGDGSVLYRNVSDVDPFFDATSEAGVDNTNINFAPAFGDYNNDGNLDIFVTIHGPNPNLLYQSQGSNPVTFSDVNGTIGIEGARDDAGFTWLDYNDDGYLDVFLVDHHGQGGGYFLWRNNGNGNFSNETNSAIGVTGAGQCVVAADLDNDGDIDIYTTNYNPEYDRSSYFRNNGNGTFTRLAGAAGAVNQDQPGLGVAVGDYDNDGWLDLYVANGGSGGVANRLFRNDGDGTFTVASGSGVEDAGGGFGAQFGDFDNDGWLDLYVTNDGGANMLFRNQGDGTFADITDGTTGHTGRGRGISLGDFNLDGKLDIYFGNTAGANVLLQNSTSNSNHYLKVKLRGTPSNRSAINARVELETWGLSMIREVDGGSGFMSQNSSVVHFGLAGQSLADEVVIKWPSGTTETASDITADQTIIVVEGIPATPGSLTLTPIYTGGLWHPELDWNASPSEDLV